MFVVFCFSIFALSFDETRRSNSMSQNYLEIKRNMVARSLRSSIHMYLNNAQPGVCATKLICASDRSNWVERTLSCSVSLYLNNVHCIVRATKLDFMFRNIGRCNSSLSYPVHMFVLWIAFSFTYRTAFFSKPGLRHRLMRLVMINEDYIEVACIRT